MAFNLLILTRGVTPCCCFKGVALDEYYSDLNPKGVIAVASGVARCLMKVENNCPVGAKAEDLRRMALVELIPK